MLRTRFTTLAVLMVIAALLVSACGGSTAPVSKPGETQPAAPAPAAKTDPVLLNGAGATFPFPIYSKWFTEYNKLEPSIQINYQSIGSGGGIKQITEQTVDFGASDAPLKDEQLKAAPRELLHIPTVLGAVVVTYNVQGLQTGLKLTPQIISGMWLGTITRWNDAKIAAENPGVTLPAKDIVVISRSDGSGTTSVFTDYLAKVSADWKNKVGAGTSVKWPVGLSSKGNEGVSGQVKQTDGSIGYVELAYAEQTKLPYADIKNKAGKYVRPSLDSVTAAAAGTAKNMPADLRVSITNPDGDASYPIASFTYILVYKEQQDKAKSTALLKFLWWAIHDGEKMAKDLLYSPLPTEVVTMAEAKLKSVTFQGQPILK